MAGVVKRSQGTVTLERASQRLMVLPGQILLVGDTVRTGPASAAGLTLADDTLLTVGPDSELVITAFSFDATTDDGNLLASLWRGTLHVVTGLIGKKSPESAGDRPGDPAAQRRRQRQCAGVERRWPAPAAGIPYATAELQTGALRAGVTDAAAVQTRYAPLLAQQPARPRSFVLLFEANTNRLAPAADAVLAEMRAALAALPAAKVIVTGHTDRVGTVESNDRLSLARAEVVRELLFKG